MILEIRLSNFYSIKDEIVLDFRAGNLRSAQSRALNDNVFKVNSSLLLKSIILYGANASGKSNIIKAIRFCHAMILSSHQHNQNDTFNFQPFKFDNYPYKPSRFSIRFLLEGVEYHYSFTLTTQEILEESLEFAPKGRMKEIFTRNEKRGHSKKEKYKFSKMISKPWDVAESTSVKTLFLSRASQMDRDIAKHIYNFFSQQFLPSYVIYGVSTIEDFLNTNKTQFIEALQIADSDIVDVKLKAIKVPGKNLTIDIINNFLRLEDVVHEHLQIRTFHRSQPDVPFDFIQEESQGTIKLFFILLTILDVVKNNRFLMIDEIEESLHPRILEYIFNLFRASSAAQLLCTTHHTVFLDLKKFRKDQIWFVNKKSDGSSDLYSLYDYSDFRDTMDLEKAYLQGRFDAVPIVNDSPNHLRELLSEL